MTLDKGHDMEKYQKIDVFYRPTNVVDLVERIQRFSNSANLAQQDQGSRTPQQLITATKTLEETSDALLPLIHQMAHAKKTTQDLPELVCVSSVAPSSAYEIIIEFYANSIIKGTADGNIVNTETLYGFAEVLESGSRNPTEARKVLCALMRSLQERLTKSTEEASPETQYHQLLALSAILNAMVVSKISGISRLGLHKPLSDQLTKLKASPEIRISQAARYAAQALLGIPDDETSYQKVMRVGLAILKPVAKLVSAGLGADATKIPELIEDIQDIFEPGNIMAAFTWLEANFDEALDKAEELITKTKDTIEEFDEGFKNAKELWERQRTWYMHLRWVEGLVKSGSFKIAKEYLQDEPKQQRVWKDSPSKSNKKKMHRFMKDENFICGLLSCLEQVWLKGQHREQIEDLITSDLYPRLVESSSSTYVLAWFQIVTQTLELPDWTKKLQNKRKRQNKISHWLHKDVTTKVPVYTPPRDQEVPPQLFLKAWTACESAQRFYADAAICEHYTRGDLLNIQRTSGDPLDIGHCYINTAIRSQEISKKKSKSKKALESLIGRHQNNIKPNSDGKSEASDELDAEKVISLAAIFDPQIRDDRIVSPRRILVRGRAGIGKTTLCKSTVHRFLHGTMWAGLFHRVLWIPLRSIKRKLEFDDTLPYSLEQLFHDQFFSHLGKDEAGLFSTVLTKNVDDPKTLFILDGLDEVSDFLGPGMTETPLRNLLRGLLDVKTAIVTSRSFGITTLGPGNFDLELETVGFNPDQVASYVKMANPHSADLILNFIRSHVQVQGLARIPVQLDAFCFSWNSLANFEQPPTTMTGLYEAISSTLWRISLPRLYPKMSQRVEHLTKHQIRKLVGEYSTLLGAMAFTGMCGRIIEFERSQRDVVAEIWSRETDSMLFAEDLLHSSFLRTSESDIEVGHAAYHFLHLTYQDYFAAQFFVDHWRQCHDLWWCDFEQKTRRRMTPSLFLQKEKYNPQFDTFWRFATGILSSAGSEDDLLRFFKALNSDPIDLLGPAHQRLVLHCFNEIESSEDHTRIKTLQKQFEALRLEWVRSNESLMRGIEFPDHLLYQKLENTSMDEKTWALAAIQVRGTPPSEDLLQLIIRQIYVDQGSLCKSILSTLGWLSQWDLIIEHFFAKPELCQVALQYLEFEGFFKSDRIPASLIEYLSSVLVCNDPRAPEEALEALCTLGLHQEISIEIRGTIKSWLTDRPIETRLFRSAFWFLLKSETIEDLLKTLRVEDYYSYITSYDKSRRLPQWMTAKEYGVDGFEKLITLLLMEDNDIEGRPDGKTIKRIVAEAFLVFLDTGRFPLSGEPHLGLLRNNLQKSSNRQPARYFIAQLLALPPICDASAISFLKKEIDNNTMRSEDTFRYLLRVTTIPQWLCGRAQTILKDNSKEKPSEISRQAWNLIRTLDSLHKNIPAQIIEELRTFVKKLSPYLASRVGGFIDPHYLVNIVGIFCNQSDTADEILEEVVSSVQRHVAKHDLFRCVSARTSIPESLFISLVTDLFNTDFKPCLITTEKIPQSVLDIIVTGLDDEDHESAGNSSFAAAVLLSREDCYTEIPRLAPSRLKKLHQFWAEAGKEFPLALCVIDDELCIWTATGLTAVPFENEQAKQSFLEVTQHSKFSQLDSILEAI